MNACSHFTGEQCQAGLGSSLAASPAKTASFRSSKRSYLRKDGRNDQGKHLVSSFGRCIPCTCILVHPPHYIKTPCTNTAHIYYMIKCTFKRKLSVWLLENTSLHKQLALHFYSVYCWRKFKRQFIAVFNCFRREAVVHFLKLPSSDVLILSVWLGF